MKCFGEVRYVTNKNRLDFGGDQDHVTLGLALVLPLSWRRFALFQCPRNIN